MHGRVKVRTTEEEKEIKALERQKKVSIYKLLIGQIQEKRKSGQLNNELLTLTAQLLLGNPDIYTLWNIRRETLLQLSNSEFSDNEDELVILFDSELQLTESCLRINPKSYCAWHQRKWVLDTRSNADWEKELLLCNTYLNYDERNFHTWDYRRYVLTNYNASLEDEFNFTTEKIQNNFSNYSAWHYRSKILPKLYPDKQGGRPIEEKHHQKELEMVQNAAFTDPDDTSAWFYQRWLLGAVKGSKQIIQASLQNGKIFVAFNRCISKNDVVANVHVSIGGKTVNGSWQSPGRRDHDVLWVLQSDDLDDFNVIDLKVEYKSEETEHQILICRQTSDKQYFGSNPGNFKIRYSDAVVEELDKQLKSCWQLLELEPNNKWTLLATTYLLHCLDPCKNITDSLELLERLKTIDRRRSGYYSDLASKWIIENYLHDNGNINGEKIREKIPKGIKLTALYHLQYWSMCTSVNFSNNSLSAHSLPALMPLQNCEVLDISNNEINTLRTLPKLPKLRKLCVTGNKLSLNDINECKHRLSIDIE